ncbi:hypothetical protein BCR44DRAFT_49805 [Catenaria anguillulae PL171]|uniref:Uncharacterized protein n=1 Tax=Catenaria anguillulae PL171 TaxID=765915 RepID=A0A1Y2I1H8_9FUNG|nr:hypothetical protein BCR44DRAFT_49805 [Catenaria anguillulae PL171]
MVENASALAIMWFQLLLNVIIFDPRCIKSTAKIEPDMVPNDTKWPTAVFHAPKLTQNVSWPMPSYSTTSTPAAVGHGHHSLGHIGSAPSSSVRTTCLASSLVAAKRLGLGRCGCKHMCAELRGTAESTPIATPAQRALHKHPIAFGHLGREA